MFFQQFFHMFQHFPTMNTGIKITIFPSFSHDFSPPGTSQDLQQIAPQAARQQILLAPQLRQVLRGQGPGKAQGGVLGQGHQGRGQNAENVGKTGMTMAFH